MNDNHGCARKDIKQELKIQIGKNKPFSDLTETKFEDWIRESQLYKFKPGEKIIKYNEINKYIYIVLQGSVRMLINDETGDGIFTLDKRGPGQILGWTNLRRGEATEFIQASLDTITLALPSSRFIEYYNENKEFAEYFNGLTNIQESYIVARESAEAEAERPKGWKVELKERILKAKTVTINSGNIKEEIPELPAGWNWHLSTRSVIDRRVGEVIDKSFLPIETKEEFKMPIRLVGLPKSSIITKKIKPLNELAKTKEDTVDISLEELGIVESSKAMLRNIHLLKEKES